MARWGRASVITATNTFPHIPDLADFITGIKTALAPGGAFVIEAHYLVDLVEQVAFDTIYHEHVSYWALGPMIHLFARHGMAVVDAERLPLHHGQLRASVQRKGEGSVRPSVATLLEAENSLGIGTYSTYQRFAQRTRRLKEDLHRTLTELRAQGKSVVGYGAPAKGNTLLSFLDIGPSELRYIVDRSPLKQGRYTPGTHIPVVPVERLLEDQPDYVVLLAWNFAEEVLQQQAEYRRRGGRFILPVPPRPVHLTRAPEAGFSFPRAPMTLADLTSAARTDTLADEMFQLISRLYPICRSITGNGVRDTLRIIQEHIPLTLHEIPTGTRVFDWTVPKEWNIRDAYIKNPRGERVLDFSRSNLHVVGYSVPIRATLPLCDLKKNIFTLPDRPDWIPYRTSYYTESWGLCMSHTQLQALQEGEYEVCIDATLQDGSLTLAECFIPGKRRDEILISCHTCHPSLCNDNLSGVALATFLARPCSRTP